jgi:hypothetical protein
MLRNHLFKSSSPYINHFLSADTIVPGYSDPQNLNRYSYVRNNPLRYNDPTGHMADYGGNEGGGGCNSILCFPTPPSNPPSGGNITGTPISTSTPASTPTTTPTSTPTPPCTDPTNNCLTNVAGQATSLAYQSPTVTPTATLYGAPTPFGQNAVNTVVAYCFGGPDLSNAMPCGEMVDMGAQALAPFLGIPPHSIPPVGEIADGIVDTTYLATDLIENINIEPLSPQEEQNTTIYTILAILTLLPAIPPWP